MSRSSQTAAAIASTVSSISAWGVCVSMTRSLSFAGGSANGLSATGAHVGRAVPGDKGQ
jgi:hypothetical protein